MTATGTDTYTAERWQYAGRRLAADGTLAWVWHGPDGKEMWYGDKMAAGSVIGGVYEARVERTPDRTSLHGSPEFREFPRDHHPDRDQWAVADRVARTRHQLARTERTEAKRDPLDELLAPLLAHAGRLRTQTDRDVLAAYVIRRINSAWSA